MSKEEAAVESPVIAKLRAARQARSGTRSFKLKTTGIEVSVPQFRAQGPWTRAAQMAGKNTAQMSTIYIVMVAKFEGETLTLGEYQELIPADDHIQISGELFGGDDTVDAQETDARGRIASSRDILILMRKGFAFYELMEMSVEEVAYWAEENEALERAIAEASRKS